MATIKSYTDIEQSKKLAKILPHESADMTYLSEESLVPKVNYNGIVFFNDKEEKPSTLISCWSLTALLKYLSEIKPQVYTPVLFSTVGKEWVLQFVEYGHGNVCEVSSCESIDTCVAMVEKLRELKLL